MVAVAIVVPQIALASWWNPFSWFKKQTPQLTSHVQTTEIHNQKSTTATSTSSEIEELKKEIGELKKQQQYPPVVQAKKNEPIKTQSVQATVQHLKTYTLANGAIVDINGNIIQAAPQKIETQPKEDDKTIGINYFNLKKTCIGLSDSQYSYCVSYALNSEVQTSQQIQTSVAQAQVQQATQQQTAQQALQAKQEKLNAVNKKIADLNAKYLEDLKAINTSAAGRGITSAGLAPQISALNRQYDLDYAALQVEYQQIQYSN